ncbi:hypothetical protein P6U16_18710 [Rhizobium sp. 32-5/1]|uniref:hypothetical protein n=1 Tax=Rhizobium sp. 32-5/1 TaxID=3019602 RepID=UPI00240E1AE7|nr:hypothetical protein [Rhizobium sp. 32-5/1]WEZ82959.1 hypothetical protein P6U16_18710 [Rhizobium sp. 32-5/1]
MGLDDEIGAMRMTMRDMRWGTCLAIAALVLVMLMIMGMMAQAKAGTELSARHAPQVSIPADALVISPSAADAFALPMADETIHTGSIPVAEGRALVDLARSANADRHIQIGILLMIVALMAATTFSLWRWQLRGLMSEASNRDA